MMVLSIIAYKMHVPVAAHRVSTWPMGSLLAFAPSIAPATMVVRGSGLSLSPRFFFLPCCLHSRGSVCVGGGGYPGGLIPQCAAHATYRAGCAVFHCLEVGQLFLTIIILCCLSFPYRILH